jgi:hypothetical protein
MTVPTPVPVCVCPERSQHGGGHTPGEPKPHDVAVLSADRQRRTAPSFRHTPLTNYILVLFSSSRRVENNTNLRLRLGGVA